MCDGKGNSARHGTHHKDWSILRWESEGNVLVPLTADWWVGGIVRCWLWRRQGHSKIGVGGGHYGYLISKLGEYCPDVVSDALIWIKKKVEMFDSLDELEFSRRVMERIFQFSKCWPRMLFLLWTISLSEGWPRGAGSEENGSLSWFTIIFWNFDGILGSLWKVKICELVKTVLHDVEIHQKISVPNYQNFKTNGEEKCGSETSITKLLTSGMGKLNQEQWLRTEKGCQALEKEKKSVTCERRRPVFEKRCMQFLTCE